MILWVFFYLQAYQVHWIRWGLAANAACRQLTHYWKQAAVYNSHIDGEMVNYHISVGQMSQFNI